MKLVWWMLRVLQLGWGRVLRVLRLRRRGWGAALPNTEVETFTLDVLMMVGGGVRQASAWVVVATRQGNPLVPLVVNTSRRRLWWHLAARSRSEDGVDGWWGLGRLVGQLVLQTLLYGVVY